MNAEVLSPLEVARLLDVSPMTIYRLIGARELRAYRIGRSYRIRRDDFEAFMQEVDTWGAA